MDKNNTDRLFEELLREGASLAAEEMGEEAQEYNTEFSERHKAKMEKLFARERRKERRKERARRAIAYTPKIAAVLVIVAALSGVAIFKVDALKIRILNIFTGTNPTNTDVVFQEGKAYVVGNITLDYIPEGFELEDEKIKDDMTALTFISKDDFFNVVIRNSDYNLSLDTEDADVKTVNLNGREAFYTEKDNTIILTGYLEDSTISLIGNIDKNTLCKIYQNIEFN